MPQTWTPEALSDLMRSYQSSCVLLAACELNLFSHLAPTPKSGESLAKTIGADLRGLSILLDALASQQMLVKTGDTYALSPGVADVLTETGEASQLAMAQHQANCLRNWAEIARVVKTGRPQRKEPSIRGEAADYAAFIEAMDNISRITAQPLVNALPEIRFSHLLDVGGASGTWTLAFLRRYPAARATLFDLPKVIPQASARLSAAGVSDRVRLVGGDFMADPLPPGADMAWVSAIIHQMSRAENRRLYESVFRAINPGGQILIRDHVMDSTRTQPVAGAMFAVNMLVNTETGHTFTFDEIASDLRAAGFVNPRLLNHEPTMNCVVSAEKPR